MKTILRDFLSSLLSENWVDASLLPITLIIITLTAILAYLFCHSVISVIVKTATRRTKSDWDDDILNERFLKAFSQLAPAIVVAYLLPDAFDNESKMYVWLTKLTEFYIVWAFVHLANQLKKTKSGIILTGSAKEKPEVAEVIAVGPAARWTARRSS